jgi:hypothetical protein
VRSTAASLPVASRACLLDLLNKPSTHLSMLSSTSILLSSSLSCCLRILWASTCLDKMRLVCKRKQAGRPWSLCGVAQMAHGYHSYGFPAHKCAHALGHNPLQ